LTEYQTKISKAANSVSRFMSFTPVDSTKHRLRIFEKTKLWLYWTNKWFSLALFPKQCSITVVYIDSHCVRYYSRDDLSKWENVHRLYTNTIPFYIKDLSILQFWYLQGILETDFYGYWRAIINVSINKSFNDSFFSLNLLYSTWRKVNI
jgi:hypothetical protein